MNVFHRQGENLLVRSPSTRAFFTWKMFEDEAWLSMEVLYVSENPTFSMFQPTGKASAETTRYNLQKQCFHVKKVVREELGCFPF